MEILKINDKHELYRYEECFFREFKEIQIEVGPSKTRFFHRTLVIGSTLIRFDEKYWKIIAVRKLGEVIQTND